MECHTNEFLPPLILGPNKKRQRKFSRGIVLGIMATMLGSAFSAGHNLAVINTPQQIIREWIRISLVEEYGVVLSSSEEFVIWGLVVSIYVGGALMGGFAGSFLANNLGRRNSLSLIHFVFFLSGLILVGCQYMRIVELLLIGRLIAGLAAGAATALVPLYLSEICSPSLKGVMGTLFPLGLCAGMLVSQVLGMPSLLGTESTWAYLVGGHVFYSGVSIPFHFWIPRSPTHLYLFKKDSQKARKVLCQLRHNDEYSIRKEETALIAASLGTEKQLQGGNWKLFTDKRFHRSLGVVMVLNAGQQLIGINAVFFYSTLVFHNSGFDLKQSQVVSICAVIPNLLMSIMAIPLVRYVRRKTLLMVSGILYSFWQLILSLGLYYAAQYSWASWLAFIAVFASVLSFGIGMGPVPYMIGTEIFPSDMRGLGLAIGGICNWGANLFVSLLFPLVQKQIGIYSFLIFTAICVCLLVFVHFVVPETFRLARNEEEVSPDPEKVSPTSYSPHSPLLLKHTPVVAI